MTSVMVPRASPHRAILGKVLGYIGFFIHGLEILQLILRIRQGSFCFGHFLLGGIGCVGLVGSLCVGKSLLALGNLFLPVQGLRD